MPFEFKIFHESLIYRICEYDTLCQSEKVQRACFLASISIADLS